MLRYKEGDVAAFDVLFSRHNGGVFRYFLRNGQVGQHAEELAQEVWMKVLKAAGRYEVTAKFTTWLYRIAHNHLVDHVRARSARPEVGFDDQPEELESLAIPTYEWPDNIHERSRQMARLARALAELPLEQAEAFLLHEEGELTLDEIAQVTGVMCETVKSRLRYALAKLRKALAD